jgi:hypothetical protein
MSLNDDPTLEVKVARCNQKLNLCNSEEGVAGDPFLAGKIARCIALLGKDACPTADIDNAISRVEHYLSTLDSAMSPREIQETLKSAFRIVLCS